MSERPILGVYRHIPVGDGTTIPFYMIPFDKRGICEGPQTRQQLVDTVADGNFTDIFLFSHGWNTDWQAAVRGYTEYQKGYAKMRAQRNLPLPDPYHPLLVGIFWPSIALVFSEESVGPAFAAGDPDQFDAQVAREQQALRELTAPMTVRQATRFYELIQQPNLTEAEALELAQLALEIYDDRDDDLGIVEPLQAKEVLALWQEANAVLSPEEEGTEDDFSLDEEDDDDFGVATGIGDTPAAAGDGGLSNFDPRNIVRLLTVYQMKDRAGVVGAHGVGPLLSDLLAATDDAHVHLLGHSYGCKVVLSALCAPAVLPRPVDSVLLLQPAVNHLCFAASVGRHNQPGGYRKAFDRVKLPILSTYSGQDFPLHDTFHLALRRGSDLGELKIAAGAGEPPSRFAALGGYGPREAGEVLLPICDPEELYDLASGTSIIGLDGTRTIDGHGGIINESTWWALYQLVAAAHQAQ